MTLQIRFDDGAAYERYMGVWSHLAGEKFLDWLAPAAGMRWLDVGCGNGAFTEMIVARCAPAAVHGIDPSEGQLAYARTRPALRDVQLRQGDAMALPYADNAFDAAVMPLVIVFVADPALGVSEMRRVVRPGGVVSAYMWDMASGGFPYAAVQSELRALDVTLASPPSPRVSDVDSLRELWTAAGLDAVETNDITVSRTFEDFDDYWTTVGMGPSVRSTLASVSAEQLATLKERLRARLTADAAGRITYEARASAVKGVVPSGSLNDSGRTRTASA